MRTAWPDLCTICDHPSVYPAHPNCLYPPPAWDLLPDPTCLPWKRTR